MPRFFTDDINENTARISGDDAVHIGRSLRMRLGDEITLCSGGMEYLCKIRSISDKEVLCDVISSQKTKAEPSIQLTLFQAVPKQDKLEFIVQKAVELGVCKIVPVLTERCISRPDGKSFEKKRARLQKIAEGAAKQSGRGIIPQVTDIISIEEAAASLNRCDVALICYEKGGERLCRERFDGKKTVGLMIGCEGGFSESEVKLCEENGALPIWLGERILRCETAPLAAVSIIMHLTGNM